MLNLQEIQKQMLTLQEIQNQITPDWATLWTKEEMEKEMPGFFFLGVGWYLKPEASMLIFASPNVNVNKATEYVIWIFFKRDPRPNFQAMIDAPVRSQIKGTSK
jgi:hypothetical protein